MRRALLILLLALGLLGAGCGNSSSDSAATINETASTETASTETSADVASNGCTDVAAPAPREDGSATAPKERLDPEKTYDLVVKTSCGSFTVTLDLAKAPATATSLVALATTVVSFSPAISAHQFWILFQSTANSALLFYFFHERADLLYALAGEPATAVESRVYARRAHCALSH